MDVSVYIRQLLFNHECVIVPDFGAFITRQGSAEIHPVTHRFTPPFKDLAFNSSLKKNDGLLKNAIVTGEGISYDEASTSIEEFVESLESNLRGNGFTEIMNIGRFFYNVEGKLEFEPEQKVNFSEDSFGLGDFIFKPIENNKMEQANRPPQKLARKSEEEKYLEHDTPKGPSAGKVLAIIIPILIILGTGSFFLIKKDNPGGNNQSAFMSFLFGNEKVVEQEVSPAVKPVVEAPVAEVPAEAAPIVEETDFNQVAISGKQGRFSVIVGSFRKKRNAEKFMQKVNQKGEHTILVEPTAGSGNYRVSVAEYNEKAAALNGLEKYRQQYQDAWLMLNN